MQRDELGDRIKGYEGVEAGRKTEPLLPVVVRLDGRSFSSFTRGLARPYDERLSQLMVEVTTACVHETGARVGYTQSDEITLVLYSPTRESQIYFDGRIQKITSSLAAFASVEFNRLLPERIPEKAVARPTFDCRAFAVPSLEEAANAVLWRELDATKNSISMAAHAHFSPAALHKRDGREMVAMLRDKGVVWEDFPAFFRRGTFVQRVTVRSRPSVEELEALPPKHHARLNPDLEVERSAVWVRPLPPLLTVSNRVECLFFGAAPHVAPRALAEGQGVVDG